MSTPAALMRLVAENKMTVIELAQPESIDEMAVRKQRLEILEMEAEKPFDSFIQLSYHTANMP